LARRQGLLQHKLSIGQILDPRVEVVDNPVTLRQRSDLLDVAA